MKVDDARVPTTETTKASAGRRPSSTSFSEVLGRKSQAIERKKNQQDGQFPLPDGSSLGLSQITSPDQPPAGVVFQSPAEMRSEAADIQALVQEILVVSKPNGQHSVEIQFDSKTLDGLHVDIGQEQNQIAIRFSAASASVSDLLSRNLDQLSEALHRQGLQVAPIQIEIASAPAAAVAGNSESSDRHRGEQNEERRQQQKR